MRIDSVIDSEIDKTIYFVNNNTQLTEKFISSWSSSKAEELTNEVIEFAFNFAALNYKIELLSSNIANEIANQLELISIQSSSYAMNCIQSFIGRQYSNAVVEEFNQKVESSIPDPSQSIEFLSHNNTSLQRKHLTAVGGGLAIVVSANVVRRAIGKQIAKRVTQKVVGRITGRIGTAFIPFIGEIVGGVMIASDIITSFNGALPQIQKYLKSEEIKQLFKDEIAKTLDVEIRNESSQIVREISNELYAEWLDFQNNYHETLTLIQEIPEFREIFDRASDKSRVYLLVGILLNNFGRKQLKTTIKDGLFTKLLFVPEVAYRMLQTTNDPNILIDWNNLAGNQIEDVVNLELYKHLSPEQLSRQMLKDILSLEDSITISKLSLLEIDAINSLFKISTPNLIKLANLLSAKEVQQLSAYLPKLKQHQINQFIKFLLDDNPKIIANSNVMHYLVESKDVDAAIELWQGSDNLFSWSLVKNISRLLRRSVSWGLFAEKYGFNYLIILSIIAIALPIILLSLLAVSLRHLWQNMKQNQEVTTIQN